MQEQLLNLKNEALGRIIGAQNASELEEIRVYYLGKSHGKLTEMMKLIPSLPNDQKGTIGKLMNDVKKIIEGELQTKSDTEIQQPTHKIDLSLPGIIPETGHLHIVTQAINEITEIFNKIGFSRVRHPEVDWDWYAFESLNMPSNHAARDEWETFFIDFKKSKDHDSKKHTIVLTPHTSNGQVREMEKKQLPIRMINIAKCYRRQSDVSHVPMFHQFEGLYVDKNVSICHLKGVMDYFVKQFFGPDRKIRLRPYHFQFTEPSFEIDISCGICHGAGCRLCKEGWLELGGSGMVHPNVLRSGGIDPNVYSGFAFGWGIERTYMMKSGTKIDDIRILYGNDLRFLEQF